MIVTLYKVLTDTSAPHIELDAKIAATIRAAGGFCGRAYYDILPKTRICANAKSSLRPKTFCSLAKGVLAIDDAFYGKLDDLYYALAGEVEVLDFFVDCNLFRAINPVRVAPRVVHGDAPCVLRPRMPLFRIQGDDPFNIYCTTGMDIPLNEFKTIYDHHGLQGLIFESVWHGDITS